MPSTLIELAGMGCLTEAAYVFGGRGYAFLVAGVCLLAIGALTNDQAIRAAASRVRLRLRRKQAEAPAGPPSPHPDLEELLDPGQEEVYRALAEAAERRSTAR